MFWFRRKKRSEDVFARCRERSKFAVEQLEPKILLSAAPIDAPNLGSDHLYVQNQASLGEVPITSAEVVMVAEVEAVEGNLELIANGEVFDWSAITSTEVNNDEAARVVKNAETLQGSGALDANLDNQGTLAPGNSPGTISVVDFTNSGTLQIELAGTADTEFDRIVVTGSADLGGSLEVTLLDGFLPESGDRFQFIEGDSSNWSGDFASFTGLELAGGLELIPVLTDSGYELLALSTGLTGNSVSLLGGDLNLTTGVDSIDAEIENLISGILANVSEL